MTIIQLIAAIALIAYVTSFFVALYLTGGKGMTPVKLLTHFAAGFAFGVLVLT